MCREPITNFVCQEHIARDIARWLPENETFRFEQFHERLSGTFRSFLPEVRPGREDRCTCKSHDPILCVYCYTAEVNDWLAEQNPALAEQFRGIFSFGFHPHKEVVASEADSPEPDREFGLCDTCGVYSNDLDLTDTNWI